METTFTKRNSHGANLKRWREWRGIKQEVLADKIGVSQATLSGYEKKDELEPEVLEKVTKALDIPRRRSRGHPSRGSDRRWSLYYDNRPDVCLPRSDLGLSWHSGNRS